MIAHKDDDDHHFDDDQNLFLTCEWFYDASLTSPTLGPAALERRRPPPPPPPRASLEEDVLHVERGLRRTNYSFPWSALRKKRRRVFRRLKYRGKEKY